MNSCLRAAQLVAAMAGRPHGAWFIKPVDALGKPGEPGKPDGALNLEAMEIDVDPRAEWKQMFREVLRIERDFFYDPNMHGADLKALAAAYQPFVDNVMSRVDLNYILADMLGEITAQHVYISGGDRPEVKHVSGGLLGADYKIENGRYRLPTFIHGENWNPGLRAPLTEPGVNVHEGDYLLAVDGRELLGTDEVFSFFQETAGKAVQLKVGPDPSRQRCPRCHRRAHSQRTRSPLSALGWTTTAAKSTSSATAVSPMFICRTPRSAATPISIATISRSGTSKAR